MKIKFSTTIEDLLHEINTQNIVLFKQSKMAQLGEIIDSIAHQWKTPIGIIKLYLQHSMFLLENKEKDIEKVIDYQDKSILQIDHLVNTIEEFKAFYKPVSTLENIPIKVIIDSTLVLMKDELIRHSISTEIKGDTTSTFTIIPNEFKHILINLFNNSRDAFKQHNIKDRLITLYISNSSEYNQLEISDNAGGIPADIIKHIFEPNFTTKADTIGDGIGLYILKKIIEKIDGILKFENHHFVVCFRIKIKKST